MAAPVYSVNDGTHTIDFPDGTRLELHRPQRDRNGRLIADVAAYIDPAHVLNVSTLSLLDDGACQRYAQRCAALDGQVDWVARLAFAAYHVREKLTQNEQARQPEPLRRALAPAESYPLDALGTLAAPMAKKMREVIQAPDAICGQSVLAALALAVQGQADVVNDGRTHPLTLFLIAIAESGERKTATDHAALWPHAVRQKELHAEYKLDVSAYENQLDAYKKTRDEVLRREKTLDTRRHALNALGPAPEPPLEPLLLVREPTYEGIVRLLAHGQPSIGLFNDEGGRFLGGYAMNREHQQKTISGLNDLWDGKPIDRVRSGDGASLLYGRRMSLHLMLQPIVAKPVLSDPLLIGQGFMARCLMCWPDSTAGQRPYKATDLTVDAVTRRYNARLLDMLRAALPLAPGTRNELAPRQLSLHPGAKRLWVAFHDHIDHQLGDDQRLAPIRGLGSKGAEHALRVAGVLTLVDDLTAGEIMVEQIKAGIALVQFYLTEALRLVEAGTANPDLLLAEKLLVWAQQYDYIYLLRIYQYGPNGIRDKQTAHRVAGILEEHGWLMRVEGGLEVDGAHRRDVWRVWR
jgi:Protein of unknown function (DUF3987)